MPLDMLTGCPMRSAKTGIRFSAANGKDMANYGRKNDQLRTPRDGGFHKAGIHRQLSQAEEVFAVSPIVSSELPSTGGDHQDQGGEAREVQKIVNPILPSQKEIDDHSLTHLPFRLSLPSSGRCMLREPQGTQRTPGHSTFGLQMPWRPLRPLGLSWIHGGTRRGALTTLQIRL